MHRGSSKADGANPLPADTLPLSAPSLSIEIEVARGGHSVTHRLEVVRGSLIRDAVRSIGLAPEGTAVLVDDTPVPLDLPIDRPLRLIVVPTFSGG
jgi:sulfur carrier protein ThiS